LNLQYLIMTAKAEIEKRVKWAAELLGISQLLDRYPAQLSGGQRQRVAVARAIVLEPRVLLMDEPLSSLDFDLKVRLIKFLKEMHQKFKLTVLHVTHDPFEAVSLGEKILLIEKGKITSPENSETLKEFFNLMKSLKTFSSIKL